MMARAAHQLAVRGPMSASCLGAILWPERKTRGVSHNGGGDYAAQMLLGRARRAGLVRTQHGEGSSVWEATAKGHRVADVLGRITLAERRLDGLHFEINAAEKRLKELEAELAKEVA